MSSKLPPEEYIEAAEKVRTGEYFREASQVYDSMVHDSMAERYLYLLITGLACLIMLITFIAMQSLYPLQRSVPFIVASDNLSEDSPHIRSLLPYKGADSDLALLRFFVANYVKNREEYNIEEFDKLMNGVHQQSTDEVYEQYQNFVDPRNPQSPITRFQRHSIKRIKVLNMKYFEIDNVQSMEVLYEAQVKSKNQVKKSRWQANVAFNYSGIKLDEDNSIKPVTFIVSKYNTKRLQDINE